LLSGRNNYDCCDANIINLINNSFITKWPFNLLKLISKNMDANKINFNIMLKQAYYASAG
jgi:hypothetical protein